VATRLLIEVMGFFFSELLSLHSLLLREFLHSLFDAFFQFLTFYIQLFLFLFYSSFLPVEKLLALLELIFHFFYPFHFFRPGLLLSSHPVDKF
jgi:ABC-type tungstate transport system substrate-binding protein